MQSCTVPLTPWLGSVRSTLCPGCRCVMDDDNEVRDRATFYLNVLEQKQKALNAGYILNGKSLATRTFLGLLALPVALE